MTVGELHHKVAVCSRRLEVAKPVQVEGNKNLLTSSIKKLGIVPGLLLVLKQSVHVVEVVIVSR